MRNPSEKKSRISRLLAHLLAALLLISFGTGFDEGGCDGLSKDEVQEVVAWCGKPKSVDRGKEMAVCHEVSTLASKCWRIAADETSKCGSYFAGDDSAWLRKKGYEFKLLQDSSGLIVRISH